MYDRHSVLFLVMDWQQLLSHTRPGSQSGHAGSSRSAFDQDFDRIIFSNPFRRLQDKTQVHPLPESDFVHTRLTHSLEVSSVGRSLGRMVGETILQRHSDLSASFSVYDFGAICASASLAHDVGNPPFGHAGEEAISEYFRSQEGASLRSKMSEFQFSDLLHFEGNAQGFRILNDHYYGMKLTAATLGAFTKYPRASGVEADSKRKSQKKFGYFQSEKETFSELAQILGLHTLGEQRWVRHPLAFVVEAADDICYSLIDLEDACRLNLVSLSEATDLFGAILGDKLDRAKLARQQGLNQKLAVMRAMGINAMIQSCAEVFLDVEMEILEGNFDKALTSVCIHRKALDQISHVSIEKIYRARHVVEIEASGHQILPELVHEFIVAGTFFIEGKKSARYENLLRLLPPELIAQMEIHKEDYYMMSRLVIDFVSGLTDRYALSLYRKIKGISI